jgi:hypothetical protein
MKTLVAVAIAALTLGLVASADAGPGRVAANGASLNGIWENGIWSNGTQYQGVNMQGTRLHGRPGEATIGSAILVGVELPR